MSSLSIVRASSEYIEAKLETSEKKAPSVGFIAPSEIKTGTTGILGTVIKQNNTLIYLVTKQFEEITALKRSVEDSQNSLKGKGKQEALPSDLGDSISNLTQRLDKLQVGEKIPPRTKQGPIYAHTDPNKIFREQYDKEKKK